MGERLDRSKFEPWLLFSPKFMRTSSEGKQRKCMKKLLRLPKKGYAVQLEGDGGEAGDTVKAEAQVDVL